MIRVPTIGFAMPPEKEPKVRDPTTGHECDYYGRGSRNGNIGYSFVGV
jgi:hypothetical protein